LVTFLRRFPWTTASRFSRGGLLIVDGIAFYLDPKDTSIAFAASPSTTHTNERMNLIVAEAIRVLPMLLAESPSLTQILRGRKLVVRMLDDYSNSSNAVIREQVLDWDILSGIIDGDSN
tara:strand:+ start:199 stop:555 length:357 start_codon:yes stop_codon:yes gene_type:complete